MRKQKIVLTLSNILFAVGILISLIAIILTVSLRASLPSGVCPFENHRSLYNIASAILLTSLALSVYSDMLKKRKMTFERK